MKKMMAAAILVVATAATAHAGVNVNLNVAVPAPAPPPPAVMVPAYPEAPPVPAPPQLVLAEVPRFIYSPALGYYLSVDIPYDIAYINHRYYLYSGGYWYISNAYWGPWVFVPQRRLPIGLRKFRYEQIRLYRDREYQVFLHDRGHYRGGWYNPAERREIARHEERREERRGERRDERYREHFDRR